MSEQRSSAGSALLGFILGVSAGALAALLLAPRSGKDTRRRIGHWLDELEKEGADWVEEGKEVLERGKKNVMDKAAKVRDAVEAATGAFRGD